MGLLSLRKEVDLNISQIMIALGGMGFRESI